MNPESPLVAKPDPVGDRFEEWYGDLEIKKSDRISEAVRRFLYSRTYTVICLIVVVVNISLLIWELVSVLGHGLPHSAVFFVMEILVNVTLLGEITLRFIAMRKRYFSYWGNIFDCIVFALSFLTMIFYFTEDSVFKDIEEGFTLILLACRYCVALLRVFILIKNQRATIDVNSQRIDISNVGQPPIDKEEPTRPSTLLVENLWEQDEVEEEEEDDPRL